MIRLKVPPGASQIYTKTGRAILVSADRTSEVNEHEGKPLLALGMTDYKECAAAGGHRFSATIPTASRRAISSPL
ncbi:MAG: hypothetical protein WBW81_03815 [Methylocella sp.]